MKCQKILTIILHFLNTIPIFSKNRTSKPSDVSVRRLSYLTIYIKTSERFQKSLDTASYLWYHRHTSAGGFFVVRSVRRRFPQKREIFFIYFFGGITAGVRQTAALAGGYREERKGQVI